MRYFINQFYYIYMTWKKILTKIHYGLLQNPGNTSISFNIDLYVNVWSESVCENLKGEIFSSTWNDRARTKYTQHTHIKHLLRNMNQSEQKPGLIWRCPHPWISGDWWQGRALKTDWHRAPRKDCPVRNRMPICCTQKRVPQGRQSVHMPYQFASMLTHAWVRSRIELFLCVNNYVGHANTQARAQLKFRQIWIAFTKSIIEWVIW